MRYISTRGDAPILPFDQVLLAGLAEDGGLYVPESWPQFTAEELRGLRGLDLIGSDVVEVAPPFDPSGNTALVGATLMFEILCVLADAFARRGGRD